MTKQLVVDCNEPVQLIHAALDDDNGEIILRGVLVPDTIKALRTDDYQREILPIAKLLELTEAFQHGSVPDIDVGMRGGNYTEKDGIFTLRDPVYVIDGLQRKTAALQAMKSNARPRLGATVHFNTTPEWERRRFRILNIGQTKLSSNVLLRNMYLEGSPSLRLLHDLTFDSSFPLCRRVNWDQRQHKEHLVSAMTLLKSVSVLHSSLQSGLRETSYYRLVDGFDRLIKKIGHARLRSNIMLYWSMIDQCWGIRNIEHKQIAVQLRQGFLLALGWLVTNHTDFWADATLVISADLRRKLAKFSLRDPNVLNLCGGNTGGGVKLLYQIMLNHVNSGKRSKRLTPKKAIETIDVELITNLPRFEPPKMANQSNLPI